MRDEQGFVVIAISFPAKNIQRTLRLLRRRYDPDSDLAELSRRAILEIIGREACSEELDIMAKELGID